MTTKKIFPKMLIVLAIVFVVATIFTSCQLKDPVNKSAFYIDDSELNYYNQDHTTIEEAAKEFSDSIGSLRKYLDSEDFVDSGYYMGVNFAIDILDLANNTVGNFQLKVKAYLYTFPYEDEDGNPIYKYYEDGKYYDENNQQGTRKLVSAVEIHNRVSKKSDFSIEWYNGATNSVMIGLYFDGENSSTEDPGNILYVDIQGYKRSFDKFGDTVLFQQLIRLLTSLSVEGLLKAAGLQDDAGAGYLENILTTLAQNRYKRVVNEPQTSLYFYGLSLNTEVDKLTEMLYNMFGIFGRKWDPMTKKYLGFKFSTVANAQITSAEAELQSIVSPTKKQDEKVLTDAVIKLGGNLSSNRQTYSYTTDITFDYGWTYPEDFTVKGDDTYIPFEGGKYEFVGDLYIPLLDTHYDALIRTDMNTKDNSKNNVFIEFRDIANGELMIGAYYKNERTYLDITGLEYLYGWIALEELGFPQVYDERLDLAKALNSFIHMINNTIISIVDSILDPEKSDRDNSALAYILEKTTFTEKTVEDIFSKNTETLRVDVDLVKKMLETTGQGTYSTRQIINILDSVMPYSMDQLAILLGISSAEVMIERSYFTLTWDVDSMDFTIKMFSDVGISPVDLISGAKQSLMIFSLELTPTHFGEEVIISNVNVDDFKKLEQIYTYSGTLEGSFVFSSQEVVDLSKLLSATIAESSGLNTPYVLATNAGLSFTLIYDQFVTDHDDYEDGILLKRKAGRSAFDLTVWLTGFESSIIIRLCSDDVAFNNEVYKNQPAREDELGYVWVDIVCVTKNGVQTIPKVKIREDIFMASMSAYMNNQTSITDDVSGFADNDFNLSLTSIITALCKDAYVVAEPEQLEITSSNDTLQSLFRVQGLIGNIRVDAGFRYRVKALRSIKKEYYLYEVGFFDNIEGNSPYDTPLHDTLRVSFFEDYMDKYDPLKYEFYVFPNRTFLEDETYIPEGTIMLFKPTAKKQILRDAITPLDFFQSEGSENQDIKQVRFKLSILDFIQVGDDGNYYYVDYTNTLNAIDKKYVSVDFNGEVYIYWEGISSVVLYDSGEMYYYFDLNEAVVEKDSYVFIMPTTTRDLLFEYDSDSVEIKNTCKKQYSPRTNGSFMGEVRRYFVTFDSTIRAELGKINDLYYSSTSIYPRYYNTEDELNEIVTYDRNGAEVDRQKAPIQLFVMEPCEDLTTECTVFVDTGTEEYYTFNASFKIDWTKVTKKGFMLITEVTIAPRMMGEKTFPIRIIVLNREIDTNETATVYLTDDINTYESGVPVVDEVTIDPYEYILSKYEYLMNTDNFNPSRFFMYNTMLNAYKTSVKNFINTYYAKYKFNINFDYQNSYLFANNVDERYIQTQYTNIVGETITRYNWDLDVVGSNIEEAINENGGTLYAHTYFKGQLIALKINVEKREFSYIKFSETDQFDPESTTKYNGKYNANFYDDSSYKIGTKPIFVFKDDAGNEIEKVFDMSIVNGLARNVDGSLSSTYSILPSYAIEWKYKEITNITSSGSTRSEYEYSKLYFEETIETQTMYSSIPLINRERKVKIIKTDGTIIEDYYYVQKAGDKAAYRKLVQWNELLQILEDNGIENDRVAVDYGDGYAYKFKFEIENSIKIATIRNETTTKVNRPFYYYYKKGDEKIPVLLTEEEYTNFVNGDPETIAKYGINFDTTTSLTSTNLSLTYLLRLFCLINGEVYSLSVVNNRLIKESEFTNAQSEGNFSNIIVMVEAECPVLTLAEANAVYVDELDSEKLPFTPNKVRYSNNDYGTYVVDPLTSSSIYLPNSMLIFFKDEEGNESSHMFNNLMWARSFDELTGTPNYKVNGIDVIKFDNEQNKYKVAIDIKSLKSAYKFKAYVRIGTEISGYRYVSVCISILSKDPTNIDFFDDNSTKITVEKTTANFTYNQEGDKTQLIYYNYYINTYSNYKLPTSMIAEFSDGHRETYVANWVDAATGKKDYVFTPNKLVCLKTTIGTSQDITIDVYLTIIVDNNTITRIDMKHDYMDRYVVVQNDVGERDYKTLNELFSFNGGRIGYTNLSSWKIRISDGFSGDALRDKEDQGIPYNRIGIFEKTDEEFVLVEYFTLYQFLSQLFSIGDIYTEKSQFNYAQQAVLGNVSTNILQDTVKVTNGAMVTLDKIASIQYTYDALSKTDTINVEYKYFNNLSSSYEYIQTEPDGLIKLSDLYGNTRNISFDELTILIILSNLSIDYSEWYIKKIGSEDQDGTEQLKDIVGFNQIDKKIYLDSTKIREEDTIVLEKASEVVTLSYNELVYRLNIIYNDVIVLEGSKNTKITNKRFEIKDLNKILDINDFIGTLNTSKYIVELGSGTGATKLSVSMAFAGGLFAVDQTTENVTIKVYSNSGEAVYSGGYSFDAETSASIIGTYNDGSNIQRNFNYGISDTDAKLIDWVVERSDIEEIKAGDILKSIDNIYLYKTERIFAQNKTIVLSTLTEEGFRITKQFSIYYPYAYVSTGFSGQVPNTFEIQDGVITIPNIYVYLNNLDAALKTTDMLPKTISLILENGDRYELRNVNWMLESSWGNVIDRITYRGLTRTKFASANVLGCTINNDYVGSVEISVEIEINNTEVVTLPWSNPPDNIETETIINATGEKVFVVYIDPTLNSRNSLYVDGVEKTFTLPQNLKVKYEDNQVVTFENVEYKYNNRTVTKIPFTKFGIDVNKLTGANGDLRGETTANLNERFLDLRVDLGLEQKINIRVYFYNKDVEIIKYNDEKQVSNIMPEFNLGDTDIREAIANELKTTLNIYQKSIGSNVNENRISVNMVLIFEKIQAIIAKAKSIVNGTINSDSYITNRRLINRADVITLLTEWEDSINIKITQNLYNYSNTEAFNDDEAEKYGFDIIKNYIESILEEYITSILSINGAEEIRKPRIITQIQDFFDDIERDGYNQIIRTYFEFELKYLFVEKTEKLSNEEFNGAFYYKNMLQANIDYDSIIKNVYIVRKFMNNIQTGATSNEEMACALISKQLELDDAIEAGFKTTSFEEIIVSIIVQALFDSIKLTDSQFTSQENLEVIKLKIISLIKARMDYDALLGGAHNYDCAESEYSVNRFVELATRKIDNLILNEGSELEQSINFGQKNIRLFLINMFERLFDFTKLNLDGFNEFKGLSEDLISYVNSTIQNYSSQINNIRRQIVKGSSATSIVRTLIDRAISTYTNSIILEKEYKLAILDSQKKNGIIFETIEDLTNSLNNTSGLYSVNPYSKYTKLTNKFVVYFNSEETYLGVNGGYCQVMEIDFPSKNNFEENVSYLGNVETLTTNIITIEDIKDSQQSVLTEIKLYAKCDNQILDNIVITLPVIEKVRNEILTDNKSNYVNANEENYHVVYFDEDPIVKVLIYENVDEWILDISYSNVNPLYFAEYRKYDASTVRFTHFYKYNQNGDIIYEFRNEISNATKLVEKQMLKVYNTFEFDTTTIPSTIENMDVNILWNKITCDPTGFSSSSIDSMPINGTIETTTGQNVRMSFVYAKWAYTNIAELSKDYDSTAIRRYVVEGEEYTFKDLSPIRMYFSKYHDYSAKDFFLIRFNVSIVENIDGTIMVKPIKFSTNMIDVYKYQEITFGNEIINKAFYPEDSRLLEYSLSDSTMKQVKYRNNYIMYWDVNNKNKALSQESSAVSNIGTLYLGNERIGNQYSLSMLADENARDKTVDYRNEKMRIDKLQIIEYEGFNITKVGDNITIYVEEVDASISLDTSTNRYTTSVDETEKLANKEGTTYKMLITNNNKTINVTYNYDLGTISSDGEKYKAYIEIENQLSKQDGNVDVFMSPYTYYPTTGLVELNENMISYNQEALTVRLIWNKSYSLAINNLKDFITYAYPDVESSNREEYARNLLMTWNRKTNEEQNEIIKLAMEYTTNINSYTGTYTQAQARLDAYRLLCINEQFNYSGNENKLKGGADSISVKCWVLIKVNNDIDIFVKDIKVRVIFADFTPINYYVLTSSNTLNSLDYLNANNYTEIENLYIAIKKDYFDFEQNENTYELAGKTSPYNFSSKETFKFMQFMSLSQNKDQDGNILREELINGEKCYIINVTNISWRKYDPNEGRIVSESFSIGDVKYISNLLTIAIGGN